MKQAVILSPEERAQRKRFEEQYGRSQTAVMRCIERQVCGCDYGGSSWTTRAEAERLMAYLELRPGLRLLELGAGSGWPGLYIAKFSGCDAVLTDLPLTGIRIAAERAREDGLAGKICAAVADAATLPFPSSSFDAIAHSDLLCCLRQKRSVLAACRDAVRSAGRMAFTVISITPSLSPERYRRAVANGPEFVESETDYPTMLAHTGWAVSRQEDISKDYADSCRRQIEADQSQKDGLVALIGADAFAERLADWRAKLVALGDGLLRRELFVATPKHD